MRFSQRAPARVAELRRSRMRRFIILTALLGLAGCVTMSADPRLVGRYVSTDSESLVFERDARVYFVRTFGGQDQRVLIGYAAAASGSPPGSLSIAGPDTSPFIGTSFQVSDDFRTITVDWGDFIGTECRPTQTQFHRRISG